MTYTGGTPNARACIEGLSSTGALVDIYSNEWLAANPDYCDFYPEDLVEYQRRSKGACAGHLLIISTSLHSDQVAELLTAAYAPFTGIFAGNVHHKPDLVFINLATQQILCAGLMRKNYFFGHAIGKEDVRISDGNLREVISQSNDIENLDPTKVFMRDFLQYDYTGVVSSLLEALYEFGIAARSYDSLPSTPDQIEEIIAQGPDNEGMYDIDDQLMSLEEARAVIAELEEVDECGKENLSTLQTYFPGLTWSDLNTQDY
jgi:hypothetical protein